jgi:hypothetical protein
MPLAFAALAIAVAACSGAATVPSAAAPTTAPATPAATVEPVASATPEPVPSPTAAPAAVAGCLDSAVHAILYKGLKDPDSLTADDEKTLLAGFKAWDPGEDEAAQSNREWFIKEGMSMVEKVALAIMLRAGQETIEACP